jgi:hypothetical protein
VIVIAAAIVLHLSTDVVATRWFNSMQGNQPVPA